MLLHELARDAAARQLRVSDGVSSLTRETFARIRQLLLILLDPVAVRGRPFVGACGNTSNISTEVLSDT